MKILTIKRRADFVDLQNNFEKKIVGGSVIILIKPTKEKYIKVTAKNRAKDFVRIGLNITKKVDKRAVVRNRIKRFLREINRNLMKNYNDLYLKYYDYEFIAKKNILNYSYNSLFKEIKNLL